MRKGDLAFGLDSDGTYWNFLTDFDRTELVGFTCARLPDASVRQRARGFSCWQVRLPGNGLAGADRTLGCQLGRPIDYIVRPQSQALLIAVDPSMGRSDMQRVYRLLKSADPW